MSEMEILCQNRVALRADYDEELHAFVRVTDVVAGEFAPMGTRDGSGSITRGKLTDWWRSRSIPVTRDGFQSLRVAMHDFDPMDLLEASYGLSLSDQFWMHPYGSPVEWEDVNFFDNPFDEELGLLTLGSAVPFSGGSSPNPNSSLGGDLRKAWEMHGGEAFLVKSGRPPFEQEPANELIATKLYGRLLSAGDYIPYDLESRGGRIYSVCPNMVDRDECLVSAWDIVNASKRRGSQSVWQHLLGCFFALGLPDAERQLTKMFACDYVIANHDRHWGNFGVVFDARTMRAKRVAPIYDSGSSLWCNAFELEVSADYWYRPLPLVRERARRIEPEDQLDLLEDFEWFDPDALDGFAEEAGDILACSTSLPPERVDRIVSGIERNVERIERAVRRIGYVQASSFQGIVR